MFMSPAKKMSSAEKVGRPSRRDETKSKRPKLSEFIAKRDFSGAVTLLEFMKHANERGEGTDLWLAYCAFHLGEHEKALELYRELIKNEKSDPMLHIYAAACLFYMGMFAEATEEANNGPTCPLQNRIRFHSAHRMNDESSLMSYHQKLTDSNEDQLSLASIHFLRNHFQEATDIYKRMLLECRDYLALQVYVAMCYNRLDYYDVSLEILAPYLQQFPDSTIAINLKACNQFRLYDGKAAEAALKPLLDVMATSSHGRENELIKHNLVVFRQGENALQVLQPLVGVIPEARLNLVIYHLKNKDIDEAFKLMQNVEPTTPIEYILKGVTHSSYGQSKNLPSHTKMAQQFFQLVGASASECDTIPGRQCMASCYFLLGQFDDVLIYLESIKSYFFNDDTFRHNFGLALASAGRYREAAEELGAIQDESIRSSYIVISWLARCYILNSRPWMAWELYLKMETSTDSFNLLLLIANDCYKVGSFYYAAKAFDVLWRLDPSAEYWEGKRGACCGVLQMTIAGKQKKEHLMDVLQMLQNNEDTPQAEFIVRVIKKFLTNNAM